MTAARRARARRGLGLFPLIAATYFMVSGGPYGLEDVVQKAGYGPALLILLITPIIWSLPTALMVGELSAALPHDGGYYLWVQRAMGPFWGFQEAWLSLVASIFDMAIYPTLFVLYLGKLVPALGFGRWGVLVGALMIAICAVWNISGAKAVGNGAAVMLVSVLIPFAAISIYALVRAAPAGGTWHNAEPDLVGGILVAMWNYMGWDNASTIAGEVRNPQRTYPLAMLGTVALIAASYTIPIAAMAHAGLDPSAWSTGSWVDVAGTLAGRGFALAVVAGGMVCGFGMFNALVLSYSRVPAAMAENGFLPAIFARRNCKSAPWVSIVVCAAAWTACLTLGFERLIELDILLYGFSLLLEFAALFVLRLKEPSLNRPFKVPGGLAGAALAGVGPAAVLGLALVRGHSEHAGPISAMTLGAILIAAGVLLYLIGRARATPAAKPVEVPETPV